jgi:branched-chain amino acid transport system permease protein
VVISFIFAGTRFLEFPGLESDDVAALRLIAIGLIIILLMAFRPQGLFGKKEELHLDA